MPRATGEAEAGVGDADRPSPSSLMTGCDGATSTLIAFCFHTDVAFGGVCVPLTRPLRIPADDDAATLPLPSSARSPSPAFFRLFCADSCASRWSLDGRLMGLVCGVCAGAALARAVSIVALDRVGVTDAWRLRLDGVPDVRRRASVCDEMPRWTMLSFLPLRSFLAASGGPGASMPSTPSATGDSSTAMGDGDAAAAAATTASFVACASAVVVWSGTMVPKGSYISV
mmetsp:Transcript_9488/g.23184  ORF Transcript_9488/g.23184 Transcript_9488/m.23184 type:complete len:228 (+) Transcript_9488:129-812(+)